MMRKIPRKIRQITAAVTIVATLIAVLTILVVNSSFFSVYINEIFLISALAIIVPSAILDLFNQRWVDAIEDQLPILVRGISESQETGITLVKALDQVIENKLISYPLSDEIKRISVQMSWGTSFDEALVNFKKRVGSPIVSRFCALVLEASHSGGEIKKVFTATAGFMEDMKEMDKETSSQMKPYIIVIFASFVVYLFIAILLVQSFLAPVSQIDNIPALLGSGVGSLNFKGFFYQYMLISAITGGLMAGKLGERRIIGGLKHSIILILVGYIAFVIAIPPGWMI
jgi:archaeal flagellar protein FlaJ